jgi:DNA processing protein
MSSLKHWIALEQAQGMGPAHLKEIHETLSSMGLSISDLFECSAAEITQEFPFQKKVIEIILSAKDLVDQIEGDYLSMIDAGITVLPFFSAQYPRRLLEIMGNEFPPILYVLGDLSLLGRRSVAILGDRDVSQKGEMIAYGAAKELARHDVITVSGMASGVGIIAHRSAMENGGKTTAVIPCGMLHFKAPGFLMEVMSPDRIVIVSPFYPSREMNKFNAFIRNKIICALSQAVYIVEAPKDGGIFEAAKSARKLNIPLYTTKYAQYPENAAGNPLIMEELGGLPVQRRRESEGLEPNMDQIMAHAKFNGEKRL